MSMKSEPRSVIQTKFIRPVCRLAPYYATYFRDQIYPCHDESLIFYSGSYVKHHTGSRLMIVDSLCVV